MTSELSGVSVVISSNVETVMDRIPADVGLKFLVLIFYTPS
jgi:hypothetical protein